MADRMDTCASCQYFSAPTKECRRRSPAHADRSYVNPHQPENGRVAEYTTEWPTVGSDDWCGDYEARRGHG